MKIKPIPQIVKILFTPHMTSCGNADSALISDLFGSYYHKLTGGRFDIANKEHEKILLNDTPGRIEGLCSEDKKVAGIAITHDAELPISFGAPHHFVPYNVAFAARRNNTLSVGNYAWRISQRSAMLEKIAVTYEREKIAARIEIQEGESLNALVARLHAGIEESMWRLGTSHTNLIGPNEQLSKPSLTNLAVALLTGKPEHRYNDRLKYH